MVKIESLYLSDDLLCTPTQSSNRFEPILFDCVKWLMVLISIQYGTF